MTKATMIKHYRKHSAADNYIIGFVYNKQLFAIKVKEIAPRFLKEDKASRGAGSSLRLRLTKSNKEQLIRKGAICLGFADKLDSTKYNKGEAFERIITTEVYGQEWQKDSKPFWECGDITVLNEEIQIKLDSATLTNEKQIRTKFYKRG